MDLKTERVFYEGEERKVKLLIRKLGLSLATYRNKRKLEWEPQKAFEHCLALKKKKEELKNINIEAIAKKYGVTSQAIYKRLSEGKEITEIESHFDMRNQKKESILNQFQKLEISKKYKDFYDFCIQEGLNVSSIYKNINNGMNLYDAISYSSIGNPQNIKYIYHGILLKSLCQKYCLDYSSVQFIFKKTQDYEFAFMKVIFNQIFLKTFARKREVLWEIYLNSFLKDSTFSKEFVDDNIINLFFQVYWRFQTLQKDFLCYQFLNALNISFLIPLSLEERVTCVLSNFNAFPYSSEELYYLLDFEAGFMQDFSYLEVSKIWIYKGNTKVLEKLKPSN